ncbi:hypothetical protein [Actinotalea fermentans]|uniref:Uncharacterized protein n=1 Tax=Actinotalea fermentans TaxID=43671 RepID=A0A511Z296_9CELL|nr:hypothetical protein [Actinotalea fermentans]KGM16216.1 hypothetical protein N867_02150 [Actinotalea fermentans ATCC 43279 = JCM 9966 = DSM 3133]GEN81569.1 hypothetical protein AFE02nite_33030 [Actinotalea fermentans]
MDGQRRSPAQRWLTEPRPETPRQRERRLSRRTWRWVWLWPLPATAVLLAGGMATEPYPAGTTKEYVLISALVVLAVPGAVMRLREAVRRARRPVEERLAEQREADRSRGRTPHPLADEAIDPPPGLLDELGAWALGWGFAQALLAIGLGALLTALPVAEDWNTAPLVVAVLGLLPPIALLLGWLAVAGVSVLRAGISRADVDGVPGRGGAEPLLRALVLSLGACLLGLATFGIPYAVVSAGDADLPRGSLLALARYAASDLDAAPGWVLALRVTCVLIYGGLAGVAVASPLLLLRALRDRPVPDALPDAATEAGVAEAPVAPSPARPPKPVRAFRPISPASLRRLRRHERRQTAVTAEERAVALLRARQVVAITTAGAALAVGVALWLACVTEREYVLWTLVTAGRFSGRVETVTVARDDLVVFALGLSGPPVLLAVTGWFLTRRTTSHVTGWSGPRASELSVLAVMLTVTLVPGLVGCYLVSHWLGPTSDLVLLPGAWAQLGFFGSMFGAGVWFTRRRARGRG